MPSLRWYLRRARAMPPAEIAFRARFAATKLRWRRWARSGNAPFASPRVALDATPLSIREARDRPDADRLIGEAEEALAHRWRFFNLDGVAEADINWHRDPQCGLTAPMMFGFDINHRDELLVGNIKNTWEKNRHHHLTVLSCAYALTDDERFSAEADRQLRSWVEANPFPIGVNWTHPLENAIRLIAWVWCERLLRGSPHHAGLFGADSPIWPSVYQHQYFIAHSYSRGSAANNHLIGEMAGLFIAATAWPWFDASKRWERLGRGILEREVLRQTFPSGLNREMAFAYHIFTIEFFVLSLMEAKRVSRPLSPTFRDRVKNMLEIVPLLADAGGNLPRYGDGDEGMALQIQPGGASRVAWLYRVGREETGARVPVDSDEGALAARILGVEASRSEPATGTTGSVDVADAGLFVLASKRGTPHECFILSDAGPHGFLSIAAHGHADALSFSLSAGGLPILVDPGTYVYHTEPVWRDYFRGTRAHNTVLVDGQDQSRAAGPFLWATQASTSVHAWTPRDDGGRLIASHNGYASLGVTHRRTLDLRGSVLTLADELTGAGDHDLELRFHFHPECRVDGPAADRTVTAGRGPWKVCLTFPENFGIQLAHGEERGGWYSPRFGVKNAAASVIVSARRSLPAQIMTTIELHHER